MEVAEKSERSVKLPMDAAAPVGPPKRRVRRVMIGSLVVVAAVTGWALFRPELLFINQLATDSGPPGTARILARGAFHDVAHTGTGEATIYEQAGGRRVLRFTNFETSNGPDVHVYLVAAPDATDHATVTASGFIPLGPLKGNIGNQSYELPATFDPGEHRSVTIWCKRFGVNFATAPLNLEPRTN